MSKGRATEVEEDDRRFLDARWHQGEGSTDGTRPEEGGEGRAQLCPLTPVQVQARGQPPVVAVSQGRSRVLRQQSRVDGSRSVGRGEARGSGRGHEFLLKGKGNNMG